jgi:hypothetical protein
VEPAQQQTVVAVGGSTAGMLLIVMHLAPRRPHPGITHPPSRNAIALRWTAVNTRSRTPSDTIRPAPSKPTRWIVPQHAICAATPMLTAWSEPSTCAHPDPDIRSSSRAYTTSVGAAPPIVGNSPARAATPSAVANASCCFCIRVRPSTGTPSPDEPDTASSRKVGPPASVPGCSGPVTLGLINASKIVCSCAAISGSSMPDNGTNPRRGTPNASPRPRNAPASTGSAPSASITLAHRCAIARRSATDGAGPRTPASVPAPAPVSRSPLAASARNASAASTSSRAALAAASVSGPAIAFTASIPTSPATRASRSAGRVGSSHSPDARA